jgi:hypothetical protein
MKNVHFLGNFRNCFTRHFQPIKVFKNDLIENEIKSRFFPSPIIPGIRDCDVLVMFADGYRDILPIKETTQDACIQYLSEFFSKFDRVILFDDNDSSGMLESGLFPLVDVYAKAQILKDRSFYLVAHQIGTAHRDFVYDNYSIDDLQHSPTAVSQDNLGKLRLAWNLSLSGWNYYNTDSRLKKLYRLINAGRYYTELNNLELSARSKQVVFRGRMWESVPTVGWWREKTITHIKNINSQQGIHTPNPKEIFSRKRYQEELSHTLVCPSPFGKGEICYRDFECFMNRSVLIKPNMSHLQTWPDLYHDGVTYISHKWNFLDFEENVHEILSSPLSFEAIALEGQKKFFAALSDGSSFAEHFLDMIK